MPLLAAKLHAPISRPAWAARWLVLAVLVLGFPPVHAQDDYFVTYSHELAKPDTLEISAKNITGSPKGGDAFVASALEFEYGIKTWWTTEFYLDGQTTSGQSTPFTGFRWENRIRTLSREHWINPVLYFEFADINGADKTLLEVVGHDSRTDLLGRNNRHEKKREAELKLILSSNFKGWNISENFLAEKNLANAPWEFGYAVGGSHMLATASSAKPCTFCPQSFAVALKCTAVSVTAAALASTTQHITPDRSSPGPFPGALICASPQTLGCTAKAAASFFASRFRMKSNDSFPN
jgi:hypothetical protein